MEIDLIEKLKEKDARFVTFCSGLNDKDAQAFDLQFFYSGIDEVNEILNHINKTIKNCNDSAEVQYLLTERILWMEEREAYYQEIEEIKKHLQNNPIFNNTEHIFTEEERRKYSRLLQLVTMYDKLKSSVDFNKDLDKQIETIHQFQNQLNLFYKNLFSTDELLESKDVIPRIRLNGESSDDYLNYLKSFYDKSEERKTILSNELNMLHKEEDYSFTFWKDVIDLENNSYFKLIEEKISDKNQIDFIKTYIMNMSDERFDYLKEHAKLADMEVNAPELYQQNRDAILQNLNVMKLRLQENDVHDLGILSDVSIFSSLMQYLYLYEEKEKNQLYDLEELKTKIDTYFQIFAHDTKKSVSLFQIAEKSESEVVDSTEQFVQDVTSFSDFMHEQVPKVLEVPAEDTSTVPVGEKSESEVVDTTEQFIQDVTSFSDFMHEQPPVPVVLNSVEEKSLKKKNVALSPREEMVQQFKNQLYEILSDLSILFDKFQQKFSNKEPLTEEEWVEYNRLAKMNDLYFNELKRIQDFSLSDILNESIDLNIPATPLSKDEILLYLETSLPYTVSVKEVHRKNMLDEKMKTYAKRIGSKGIKYTKKRKLPDKLFYEFRRSLKVVYSVVKPAKNFLQEYFASLKKDEVVIETQKVHIGDSFMISLDTKILNSESLEKPSYKAPLYGPDVVRVVEELLFYDEKRNAFLVARGEDEAFQYYKNGFQLVYARAQDGIYNIEDVKKHLIHESGMKR